MVGKLSKPQEINWQRLLNQAMEVTDSCAFKSLTKKLLMWLICWSDKCDLLLHCKWFYVGTMLSEIQSKTKQPVYTFLPLSVVFEVQCWCKLKIIGQQGVREIWTIFYALKSSSVHLKHLGIRVCAVSGLQVVMCLVTFFRQHLPSSLKDTLAVSICCIDVRGF